MARRPLLCLALLCASLAFTTCGGIRLELLHVDAKENCTVQERMRRATERTHRRLASMGGVTAPIHWGGHTEYIAEYLIGDPPQRAEAVVNTGSNLIWTQCSACQPTCFTQNLPYFQPSRSHAGSAVGCSDAACALGFETRCLLSDNKTCAVATGYGAGKIAGVVRTENFTFQSETARLVFGCVLLNKLSPGSLNGASGIIGLGRGKLSLPSQLGDTRFSYCLTPYFSDTIVPSHMIVGASAGLVNGSAATVTSVPFVKNPGDVPFNTFYYLPLTGITVGKAKLAVPSAAFGLRQAEPGIWTGTFIDSGSPFTSLVDVAYQALRAELVRQLGASIVPPPAETAASFNLCVALQDADKLVPPLVLHFGGGADLVVPPANYWAPMDTATACMVVFSAVAHKSLPMNETSVIGNYMQQNMHVLYDLAGGVLSFQSADCSSI